MKKYRVIMTPAAFEALEAYVDYIAIDSSSPLNALRWFEKAWDRVQSLKSFPHRCAHAPENKQSKFTIRALRVDRCLFLYRIEESSRTVRIMGFRHGSHRPLDID